MFTIEHEFDATVITLVDEPEGTSAGPLQPDVTILGFDDRIVVEQQDEETGHIGRIVLSMRQLAELRAALALPEGSYRLARPKG